MAGDEQRGRGLGPTGETVRERIKSIRGRVPVTELSTRLESLGRPIPPLGIRRIESGERRVDADDLMALAAALGVSPVTLLMPDTQEASDPVSTTGVDGEVTAKQLWRWLTAENRIGAKEEDNMEFFLAARPKWNLREYVMGKKAMIRGWRHGDDQ